MVSVVTMSDYISHHWPDIFHVAGAISGLIGAFLMANQYFNIQTYQIPWSIISAFWRGGPAKTAAEIYQFKRENHLASLQGLAFIGLGFLLDLIPNVVALFIE